MAQKKLLLCKEKKKARSGAPNILSKIVVVFDYSFVV